MKMRPGKRRQSLVSVLSRRIESCELRNPDPDQLVDYLCSNYPDYNRSSRRRLLTQVIALRESSSRRSNSITSNVSDLDSAEKENGGPKRKETKGKPDADEEKLQQLETRHLMNRKRTFRWEGEKENGDEEELSTSGEWVYGQKYEPEFDLMNSQLREKYEASSNLGKGKRVKSDVLEMEVVDDNTIRKETVEFLEKGGGESGVIKPMARKGEDDGASRPRFKDLGGMRDVVNELKRKVIVPFYHPQLPQYLGVKPTTGILLHGPPGCGKTKLAHAIANETGVPFYKISATEVVSGVSGASEENIRELFSKAYRTAPSIVFIDEIDVIASKRENLQRDMERRIVTQLLTCMDESHRQDKSADGKTGLENSDSRHGNVLVIGATNRPDALDPALRRPGRFDREILLGVPHESARAEILSVLTRNLKLEGDFDLLKIAQATPGFVGADLVALTGMAGNLAMERIMDHRESGFGEHVDGAQAEDWWKLPWSSEEMEQLSITMADFENAIGKVQPSSKREGFSAVPNVKWEDVGGLQQLRQEFESYIIRRIKFPKIYKDLGIDLETGFLLYGPPGCGKTLIAKAVANEAGANFIHIKGPELLSKYVGESELTVRTIFTRARTCSPCILFFDEVDALTTSRGKEGGEVVQRVVNQLLIELDGGEKRKDIYVIGATNRPEVMDDAILRPGRFGKRLYVPLPNAYERGLILAALAKKKPIDASVDLMAIGRDSCEKFSGADLSALMNEAAMAALEDILASEDMSRDHTLCTIKESHFKRASEKITPSASDRCVSLPNAYERGLILATLGNKKPIDASVDLMAIGRDSCEKFSGADLSALMHEAAMAALEGLASKDMGRDHPRCTIKESHFKQASAKITPSVSDEQQQYYQSLSERWKGK